MAGTGSTPSDERYWLTLESGERVPVPAALRANTPRIRVARAAWMEASLAGEAARNASHRLGVSSNEARRLREQARAHQQRMEQALGLTHEELVARMGRRTKAGLDAIALMRY